MLVGPDQGCRGGSRRSLKALGHTEDAVTTEHHTFCTDDLELAHEALARTYSRHRYQISGGREDFRFALRRASAGHLAGDKVIHSAGAQYSPDPLNRWTAGFLVGGSIEVRSGREEERFGPGDAVLYPYGTRFEMRWTRVDQEILSVDFDVIAHLAAQRTGPDAAPVRFLGMRPVSPGMASYWCSMAGFVQRALAEEASGRVPALVLAEMENTVAAAALSVFPNTTLTIAHEIPERQLGPAALRRAVAYIDAHAAEPLTLGDIASGVGVDPRALQRAFARHRATTPMGYLRRVRLENAHRDLQRADPATGVSVSGIARRWGFANLSRFAAAYHRAYGRTPQQTLTG